MEFPEDPDYSSDSVYYQGLDLSTRCETLLNTLFPNLIILDNSNLYNSAFVRRIYLNAISKKVQDLEKIVLLYKSLKSLKGIINFCDLAIEILCDKLELLSSSRIEPGILQKGSSIKQLHIWGGYEDFKSVAHYFPNLERLHICINDNHYEGPVLEKLKILELDFSTDSVDISYAFQLMDSCPNLKSAFICIESNDFFIDETLKHESLQDLVIDAHGGSCRDCNDLIRALIKYPNLKHLSLRYVKYLKDPHIKQLIPLLPNLVLFDIDNCPRVTQRAADYVQDYCKRFGRSIKFYFNRKSGIGNRGEIVSDWPHLSIRKERISRGFDFMKHCFHKEFEYLPCFLVPVDY